MMRATARGITKDRISGYVFIAPAVVLFAIFQIFPLFRTAVLSFQEFIGSTFVPVGAKNYIELFGDKIFARSLLNSTLFVAINIPVILIFTLFVSYQIYRSHRVLLGFYRIAFYLPSVASIVTISVVWKNLLNPVMGLANYVLGLAGKAPVVWLGQGYAFGSLTLILFTINVGMSLILYISAMQNIPTALIEAARIDGAGDFRIYRSLILPLCKPILVTLAIFTFMGTWNDFLWPLIVMTDDSMYTLPVALANLSLEHVQDTELMMAGSVMTIAPVLILFAAVQRHYISGIMAGGLKE